MMAIYIPFLLFQVISESTVVEYFRKSLGGVGTFLLCLLRVLLVPTSTHTATFMKLSPCHALVICALKEHHRLRIVGSRGKFLVVAATLFAWYAVVALMLLP